MKAKRKKEKEEKKRKICNNNKKKIHFVFKKNSCFSSLPTFQQLVISSSSLSSIYPSLSLLFLLFLLLFLRGERERKKERKIQMLFKLHAWTNIDAGKWRKMGGNFLFFSFSFSLFFPSLSFSFTLFFFSPSDCRNEKWSFKHTTLWSSEKEKKRRNEKEKEIGWREKKKEKSFE